MLGTLNPRDKNLRGRERGIISAEPWTYIYSYVCIYIAAVHVRARYTENRYARFAIDGLRARENCTRERDYGFPGSCGIMLLYFCRPSSWVLGQAFGFLLNFNGNG